jgi:hypothetical protein
MGPTKMVPARIANTVPPQKPPQKPPRGVKIGRFDSVDVQYLILWLWVETQTTSIK